MTEALQNLSDALAQTVTAASPSIVRVEARRRLSATGIVWAADGVIVTAHHTVQKEDNIQVGLPDGQTVAATLVGRDPTTDLAVLRAEAKNLTPLAQPAALRVCRWAIWFGLWADRAKRSRPPWVSSAPWVKAGAPQWAA